MPAEDSDRNIMSFMTLCLIYSAGGLLADQAVLPLNIHRRSTSASRPMSHADAATETQSNVDWNYIIPDSRSSQSTHLFKGHQSILLELISYYIAHT